MEDQVVAQVQNYSAILIVNGANAGDLLLLQGTFVGVAQGMPTSNERVYAGT